MESMESKKRGQGRWQLKKTSTRYSVLSLKATTAKKHSEYWHPATRRTKKITTLLERARALEKIAAANSWGTLAACWFCQWNVLRSVGHDRAVEWGRCRSTRLWLMGYFEDLGTFRIPVIFGHFSRKKNNAVCTRKYAIVFLRRFSFSDNFLSIGRQQLISLSFYSPLLKKVQ